MKRTLKRNLKIKFQKHFKFLTTLACLPAILVCGGCATNSKTVSPQNHEEATFLFHFTEFVEWPPAAFQTSDAGRPLPLVIGVLGGNPFGDELEKSVRGQMVSGRPVVVRRMTPFSNLKQCQVLFINHLIKARLPLIFTSLGNSSTLTVSDADGFLAAGGMIQFINDNGKVRFEINRKAAEKAGLKMNSQLLMMAKSPEASH